ncbi:electron transfer flavoprotein, beta subunit [Porphyromonas crevioricanis JCM 13913]|nr:electron transfer flavoprotein, beta subunit [Porphyromonas crevioricanis JCM 13913]
MGPPQAEAVLREAYAMGVDRAILLSDRKFGGADTLATSYTITQAIRNIDYDIILAGRQAIDGDTAQVGPQIAEQLDLPQITYVEEAEYDGCKTLTVRKSTEEGHEILSVDMPCMLTLLATANQPRYMRMRGIMEAYEKDVEVWDSNSIQVDPERLGLKGSPTSVKKAFTKGAKAMGTLHEELTPEEAAELILQKLKEKFII